ncbi:MAG: alkaline phosphatase D family protein [Bryobacter sp.]|nr:alkaline phosphatase D family protein [Bryobacter sp.]
MQRRKALGLLAAPAFIRAQSTLPKITHGVTSGDPSGDGALVWARGDRASRLWVEVATDEKFARVVQKFRGPHLMPGRDFTARHVLSGLAPGADYYYRLRLEDLQETRVLGEPVVGHFRTSPAARRNVRFLWSGDMVGQGYGINPDLGGIKIFETMRQRQPDFFLHSGDTIYADSVCPGEWKTPDGHTWKNLVTEAKSKVAATLDDFRGCYQYNLLDEHVRRFHAEVAQVWQWDDHEVSNNWSPGKPGALRLAAEATQAFLEYAPIRPHPRETERIYRKISYGPLLEVFLLDMRSYRAANSHNRQEKEGPETEFLGAEQRVWLKRELKASRAVWKVMAADMPLGLLVGDGKDEQGRAKFENQANGPGPALGRELEFADLLSYLKREKIRNLVWLTADVHYTAAHYYDPAKAVFTDFDPFWEFVSGPLNAGTFGPGQLDPTFGPEVKFMKHPPKGTANLSPLSGMQFFGEVEIDGKTGELQVTLRDLRGDALYRHAALPRG